MAALKEGSAAPAFKLIDQDGEERSLKDFKGKFVVLFFYPKDDTPGCTIEAKSFTSTLPKFKKAGIEVIGISGGDERTKQKFCKKYRLKTRFFSDPDFAVASKYGAYGEKSFMGRKFKGIYRMTFVLNKSQKIVKIFPKVTPKDHAIEVLEAVSPLLKTAPKKTAKKSK